MIPSPQQLEGLGSAVSSPSGVWGRAPAANDFGAFYTEKWSLWCNKNLPYLAYYLHKQF